MIRLKKKVYCYETGECFESIREAAIKHNVSRPKVCMAINKPNISTKNLHWCTDLSIFDGIELSSGKGQNLTTRKKIYCYETKEEFKSIADAVNKYGSRNGPALKQSIDNPSKTAYGYHWCTDLSIFDGKELIKSSGKYVYCFETRERFYSLKEASKSIGLKRSSHMGTVVNQPNKTCGGYHWCTDLSIFEGRELTFNSTKSQYEFEIIEFIKSLGIYNIRHSDRKEIRPYEIDIFLPDYMFAIEFNGKFWHNDDLMLKYYKRKPTSRKLKTDLCESKGIFLFHIEEKDYVENKSSVLSFIKNHLTLKCD